MAAHKTKKNCLSKENFPVSKRGFRKFNFPKSRQRLKPVRNFKNFNAADFVWDISQISWGSVALHSNPNVCWKIWQSLFIEVLDRHAHLRNTRIRATSLPWITQKIKKLMRMRDFHKKRAVIYNSQIDRSTEKLEIKYT